MLLNKHEKRFKHALSLQREVNRLYRMKRAIEPIKLQTPIQHGYVRSLELNDDAKLRSDYELINKAFKTLGQVKAYHHSKEFIVRTGKHKQVKTEKHAYMKTLGDPRFGFYYSEESRQKAINKILEIKKALVHHGTVFNCDCSEHIPTRYNPFHQHYSFRYKWMIRETTKPHFLTHYTPIDAELESRIAQIDREMYDNNYWVILSGRSVYENLHNEAWTNTKYDKNRDVIYHALTEE